MKALLVYCGANPGNNPIYRQRAEELAVLMATRNIKLVFGGGSVGIMGIIANKMIAEGGETVGVIPHFLDKMEVGHKSLTEMHRVESMHERKALMEKLCDGVITLPGGYGSMDEVFEMLTWAQLGLHQKPIGLLNVNNYYENLLKQLDIMVAEGFLKPENRNLLISSDDLNDLIDKMESYQPVHHDKWMNREQT